jgi:hypothetical protein
LLSAALPLLVALLLASLWPAQAQERMTVPGTGVSLAAPKGFKPAEQFSGLLDADRPASIFVVEAPTPVYDALAETFKDIVKTKAYFATQQITLDEIKLLDTQAGKALYANGRQSTGNDVFDKWVGIYKGARTVLVTIQSPRETKLGDPFAQSILRSVSFDVPTSLADRQAHLPFSLDIVAPWRAHDTLGGMVLGLTVGPLDIDPGETQPWVRILFQDNTLLKINDIDAVSEQMLRHEKGYEQAQITSRKAVPFAGLAGSEMRGSSTDAAGHRRAIIQYLGVGPANRFIRLIATGSEAQITELASTLEVMAACVRLKAP